MSDNCNPSRGPDTLFWPLQSPGIHIVHRHTFRQNADTYKMKFSNEEGERGGEEKEKKEYCVIKVAQ